MIPGCANRRLHRWTADGVTADGVPALLPEWYELERRYLALAKSAEIAAALQGPLVECIEHPEWGRLRLLEAARRCRGGCGADTRRLERAIRRGGTYGRLHWCKAGQRAGFRRLKPRHHSTPVRCVETGELYPSVKDAAAAVGCSHSAIFEALAGRTPRAAGRRWKRVKRAAANKGGVEASVSIPTAFDAPHPHSGTLASTPAPNRVRRVVGGSVRAQLVVSATIAREGAAA